MATREQVMLHNLCDGPKWVQWYCSMLCILLVEKCGNVMLTRLEKWVTLHGSVLSEEELIPIVE